MKPISFTLFPFVLCAASIAFVPACQSPARADALAAAVADVAPAPAFDAPEASAPEAPAATSVAGADAEPLADFTPHLLKQLELIFRELFRSLLSAVGFAPRPHSAAPAPQFSPCELPADDYALLPPMCGCSLPREL